MIEKVLDSKEIIQDYERTRLKNKRILQERREQIYKEIPEIERIDNQSTFSYIEMAKKRISKKDVSRSAVEEVKKSNHELTAKKQDLLEAAGYPRDYLDQIYTCPICQDTGYQNGEKCKCFTQKIIDMLYSQSNLKGVLQKENFDNFNKEYYSKNPYPGKDITPYDNICSMLDITKQYIDYYSNRERVSDSNQKINFLMYGESGLGKTYLSNCIAKALLDKGLSVLYLSSNELFNDVIGGYIIKRMDELESLYKLVYDCELLVIDDLGTEFTNRIVQSHIFEIVNKRQLKGKSTIISTNLNIKELSERYTERLVSRIGESFNVFCFYGDNVRYLKRSKSINSNI